MLERQVEKETSVERRALVEAAVDGCGGYGASACVARKGPQRAAVDVARELIEQQHKGQRAVDRARPVVEVADACGSHTGTEQCAELFVEGGVALEPKRPRPLAEPEFENLAGQAQRHGHASIRRPA